ncbi:MAG: hypothetical protein ABS81_02710 [Pseudonocardia sp. SCN 72-86]|nr:MAG: hypothetical protein ABS81_02710 [Pseudonocardia sp. SCN 72-86]
MYIGPFVTHPSSGRRRRPRAAAVVTALLAAAAVLAGCGATDAAGSSAPEKVTAAHTNSISDAPYFIAAERGYFAAEGLQVDLQPFKSGADVVAPLGSGDLDVGSGGPSAGFYNALGRGIDIRIVADKGRPIPGHSYSTLLVRKDLVDSGRFRSLADLKGLTVAGYGDGSTPDVWFSKMLKDNGIARDDVRINALPGPEQVVALQNGSVDAATTAEPNATQAVESGAAVRFAGSDEFYPDQQVAVLLYSGAFAKDRPAVATAFMRAWLRGVRDYNAALAGPVLAGPGSDDVIAIIRKYIPLDPALLKKVNSQAVSNDGAMNVASLQDYVGFYRDRNLLERPDVDVAKAVDTTFIDAAVADLGRPKTG